MLIRIRGLVQGVGFRPFVYRLAKRLAINGMVENNTNGVTIHAKLSAEACDIFVKAIKKGLPSVASIHSIDITEEDDDKEYEGFTIAPSDTISEGVTQVSPDIAICPKCLNDRTRQPHRIQYPFINCTECGPRFTIIKDLPYDRERTTMAPFKMCNRCRREYLNMPSRRFHAQPIACNRCGPTYSTVYQKEEYTSYPQVLEITTRLIKEGDVIAVRGLGGYHLVCDALNEEAVRFLRKVKQRNTKPFAVMFRSIQDIKEYALVNQVEEHTLVSWRRPIVLLRQHKKLASAVNPGMQTLGCMLPYMAIHYDWFEALDTPALVMTSGNINDLPIAISPEEIEKQFGREVTLLLHHNRDIYNRADDSVIQVCKRLPCMIRRSRGYAPEALFVDTEVEGILAFGAEKVNTFALGRNDTIIPSQYIGDLKNWETLNFYRESMERFKRLFRFEPRQLVCDLHPEYQSSREAKRAASDKDLPLIKVQHHHAHAAACMAEYGLDELVIAVVFDGAGLGDDGTIWGGEFLLCDRASYKRLAHLARVVLPGGDKASLDAWRMAMAYLHRYKLPYPKYFVETIGSLKVNHVRTMIEKRINTPLTSSAGRLFDAVSSLLDICHTSSRQGEAAILLEQVALTLQHKSNYSYPFTAGKKSLPLRDIIKGILADLTTGVEINRIAYRFHLTLAKLIVTEAKLLLKRTNTSKVVISGGCFQNRLLTELLQQRFHREGIPLYVPSRIPCNDGGISVGQITVAAAQQK